MSDRRISRRNRYFVPSDCRVQLPTPLNTKLGFRNIDAALSSGLCDCPSFVRTPSNNNAQRTRSVPHGLNRRGRHGSRFAQAQRQQRRDRLASSVEFDVPNRIWTAFRLCIEPLHTDLAKGLDARRSRHRQTAVGIEILRRWIHTAYHTIGTGRLCKEVKTFSNWCRWKAMQSVPGANVPVDSGRMPKPTRVFRGLLRGILNDPGQYRFAYCQLARVGRACPEPVGPDGVALLAKSLKDHRARFESTFETNPALLKAIRLWTHAWCNQRVDPCTDDSRPTLRKHLIGSQPEVSFSESAAAEVSKLSGGQLEDLRQRYANEMRELAMAAFGDGDPDVLALLYCETDDIQYIVDRCRRDALLHYFARERRLGDSWVGSSTDSSSACIPPYILDDVDDFVEPCFRVVAVGELGWKTRIVTAPPGYITPMGNAARRVLWPMLESDHRIDLSARDVTDVLGDAGLSLADDMMRVFRHDPAPELYSADLTAATDLMPQDVLEALRQGLLSGLGIRPDTDFWRIVRLVTGPVKLVYPDGSRDMGNSRRQIRGIVKVPSGELDTPFPTAYSNVIGGSQDADVENLSVGTLMGSPVSWFFLCLYNLALADLAVCGYRDHNAPLARTTNIRPGRAAVTVRGDDLAGCFTSDERRAYEWLLTETNGEANISKAFVSSEAFVMAEKTFTVTAEIPKETIAAPILRGHRGPMLPGAASLRLRTARTYGVISSLSVMEDIPIRHLMPSAAHGGDPAPWFYRAGPAITSVLMEFATKRSELATHTYIERMKPFHARMARLALKVNRHVVQGAIRVGLPVFLPRECGGLGFPHPRGFGHGVLSGGPLHHRRATLGVTTYGQKRSLLRLDRDPWAPIGKEQESLLAERRVDAEDRRFNNPMEPVPFEAAANSWEDRAEPEINPVRYGLSAGRAARIAVPRDRAIQSYERAGYAWSGLQGFRRKARQWKSMGVISRELRGLGRAVSGVPFKTSYLLGPSMTRRRYLERSAMAKACVSVYVDILRPSEWMADIRPRAAEPASYQHDARTEQLEYVAGQDEGLEDEGWHPDDPQGYGWLTIRHRPTLHPRSG